LATYFFITFFAKYITCKKILKIFSCVIIFIFYLLPNVEAQSAKEKQDAFSIAGELQRPVLLIFSGSDWCLPCQWLEKNIFSDTGFKNFAKDNLVVLKVDFPQKHKLSQERRTCNEQLAEEFNPEGTFPLLLLVTPKRTVLTLLYYKNYSPEEFMNQVKETLQSSGLWKEYKATAKLMGSAFEFVITADNDKNGAQLLQDCISEVQRMEKILTEFSEDSETSLINRNAGKQAVEVSGEMYSLLQRCIHISSVTDGAFDITSGGLKKLYNFKRKDFEFPDKKTIHETLQKTGFKKIKLFPNNKVYLETGGMHIGFGAIGKGYAADKVKNWMQQKGVSAGVINASGDLTVWGKRINGKEWKAGIASPDDNSKIILWLPLNGLSIATSGNYEQFFEVNGVRYSHNIDPKTGYPTKGIKSVSVISPGAELSDALATAVTVMGIDAGLHLVNQLPQTHCIIIDENNKLYNSKKINLNLTS